jgi:hypothetical protein
MDYRPISFPPQLAQESPHLSLRDADLLGGLLLGDQFLLGLLGSEQESVKLPDFRAFRDTGAIR